ncbi:MAG: UbiA prenyltransferase family protein, partial [Gemmatimonadota bacterium]|nr:UbiA prenyltransferase family protein [Gemmatimonadota bacterium]
MTALITLARPRQWIKNIVVFAGVVFAGRLGDPAFAVRAAAAFAIFCVLSSAIYVFNDLMDVEKDRLHPRKRTRPLASGRVGRPIAAVFLLALVLAGLFAAFRAGPRFGQAAVAFLLLNGMYSLWLKRHAMIDVMCISVSFLIRAIAGVRILQDADPTVALSNWLLLCTFFLALFLGFGKRRSELVLLEGDASE